MGQGCVVLFILAYQFTQQKDAVLLRGLEYLPLNVIDNPVTSAVFCTVLPQRGARLILLTVNYHTEYFVCAGSTGSHLSVNSLLLGLIICCKVN